MSKNTKVVEGITKISSSGAMSKQTTDKKRKGIISPTDDWSSLIVWYEESFAYSGIVNKVATRSNTGFQYLEVDESFSSDMSKSLYEFLSSIDLEALFTDLFVTGNSFIEIVTGLWDGAKVRSERMLVNSVRLKEVEEEVEGKKSKILKYVQGRAWNETIFEPSEVIHFKLNNIKDKYYGKSRTYSSVDQVVLLTNIDKFYKRLMEKGNIKANLLVDNENKLTQNQKDAIADLIKDATGGIENAFTTLIVPAGLDKVDLEDSTDTKAFLEYRSELIKSICIGCSFPYELLVADSSNRATSTVALKTLREDVIVPLQNRVIDHIKIYLREHKPLGEIPDDLLDKISFRVIDIENEKEKMEVLTGYKKVGIISPNEARDLSPYNLKDRPDGDSLTVSRDSGTVESKETEEVEKIKKTLSTWYTKDFLHKIQSKNVQSMSDSE